MPKSRLIPWGHGLGVVAMACIAACTPLQTVQDQDNDSGGNPKRMHSDVRTGSVVQQVVEGRLDFVMCHGDCPKPTPKVVAAQPEAEQNMVQGDVQTSDAVRTDWPVQQLIQRIAVGFEPGSSRILGDDRLSILRALPEARQSRVVARLPAGLLQSRIDVLKDFLQRYEVQVSWEPSSELGAQADRVELLYYKRESAVSKLELSQAVAMVKNYYVAGPAADKVLSLVEPSRLANAKQVRKPEKAGKGFEVMLSMVMGFGSSTEGVSSGDQIAFMRALPQAREATAVMVRVPQGLSATRLSAVQDLMQRFNVKSFYVERPGSNAETVTLAYLR